MTKVSAKLKSLKRYSLVFMFVFISLLSFFGGNMVVHAQDTRSWIADYFNPTFSIELTEGDVLFDNSEYRKEINNEINTGGSGEYSLYDRFGPDISFFCYSGEIKIQTDIIDKIYTFIADDEPLSIKTAIDIFKTKSLYVNNRVYPERIDICNNSQDPRYTAWTDSVGLGGNVSVANMYFSFAKTLEDLEAFIISDEIGLTIIDWIGNTLGNATFLGKIRPLYIALTSVLTLFMVINLVKYATRYLKAMTSFKQVMGRVFYCLLSFAIIALFMASPFILNPLVHTIVEAKNGVMNDTLNTVIDNGVINDSKNQCEATLWYINIFDPWCHGMFERSYDEMYTKNAVNVGDCTEDQTYPMSNDNINEDWSGEYRYSCAGVVGDCKVPRGNGKNVRNWAAVGYSIQSIYHIDCIKGKNNKESWPNAETTVKNPQLYVDDFRYIDAMLNITEEFSARDKRTGNIPVKGDNAPRAYGTSACLPSAMTACYRVIVLNLPLMLFAFKALVYLVEMIFFGVQCIAGSITFMIRFEEGPLSKAGKALGDTILKWLLMHIMLLFTICVYATTYETFIGNIMYMFFCVVMYIEAPAMTARERKIKGFVHGKIAAGAKHIKASVTGNSSSKTYDEAKENGRDNKYSEDNSNNSDNDNDNSEESRRRNYSTNYEDNESDEPVEEVTEEADDDDDSDGGDDE